MTVRVREGREIEWRRQREREIDRERYIEREGRNNHEKSEKG